MRLWVTTPLASAALLVMSSCAIIDRARVVTDAVEPEAPVDGIPEPVAMLDMRVLHKADYIIDERTTEKNQVVVTDAGRYAEELKKYSAEFPASIDFDSETIVVATMGTQVSGGYAISAVEAKEYADKVIVQFELVSPGDNCLTTQAQSNPYEFVRVPTKKPIEFIEVQRTQQCK